MLNYFYFYFELKGPTQGKDSSRSICGGTRISSFKSAENSGSGVLFLDFDFVIFALKPWTTGWGRLQDRRPTQEWKHGSKSRMNQTFTWWWPAAEVGLLSPARYLVWWFNGLVMYFWFLICCAFVKVHLVWQFCFCFLPICLFVGPALGNPCPSAHHHTVHQLCSRQRRK